MSSASGPAGVVRAMSQHDLVLWKSTTTGHHRRRAARVILHGDASDAEVIEVEEAWNCLVEDEDDDVLTITHLSKAADTVLGKDAYKAQDLRRALKVMDLDGNGIVNFFEFKSYMLSNTCASKDADKVKAAASLITRKTKDGEEVLEDMVMIGTMRIPDLIKIYRRRAMFECLLKVQERMPRNGSTVAASDPAANGTASGKLPPLKGTLRRKGQADEAREESGIVDAIEGLGNQVKRMFGRIFGGGETNAETSRRGRSIRGDSSVRGGDRSMRGGERSMKGAEWSVKADVDLSISVTRTKSKRLQVQTLAQDAAAVLSRADKSKAAIAQALQQYATSTVVSPTAAGASLGADNATSPTASSPHKLASLAAPFSTGQAPFSAGQLPDVLGSPGSPLTPRSNIASSTPVLPFSSDSVQLPPLPASPGAYIRAPMASCPLPAIYPPSQTAASAASNTLNCPTSPAGGLGSSMLSSTAAVSAAAPLQAAATGQNRRREGASNLGGRAPAPPLTGRPSIIRVANDPSVYKRGQSDVTPSPRPPNADAN